MNLQYTYKEFKDAVKLLSDANIDVIVHIIDGLPFESKLDQINTIKKILLYTVGIVGGLFLLGVVYQILEFLFVGAILLIAWLGPVFPRRWR